MQHRSISRKLQKAKSPAAKLKTLQNWASEWHQDQSALIAQLERAIKTDNYDDFCIATGQLKTVTQKRFEGLANVIKALFVENIVS